MNATHLHLLLNHVTVLGNAFGIALMAYALWRKNDTLKKDSLGVLVLAALTAIPVYLTGEPAAQTVKLLPEVSKEVIARHEEVAQLALATVLLMGTAALVGLIVFRRGRPIPVWFSLGILTFSLVSGTFITWTANLGGQIRHPEIRAQR